MIRLLGLSCRFGSLTAVDDVTLEIAAGERVVIQGPSGCGKTTLLRLVAGLQLPSAGQVQIDGQLASTPAWARPPHTRRIGMVFQRSALWPHLTVAQNILFAMDGRPGAEKRHLLASLLGDTGLDGLQHHYPHQLSGGQARRVALARALASQPARLLLDEPLTSLEPELKDRLAAVIGAQVDRLGCTLVYVTHDNREAGQIGGRQLAMQAGKVSER